MIETLEYRRNAKNTLIHIKNTLGEQVSYGDLAHCLHTSVSCVYNICKNPDRIPSKSVAAEIVNLSGNVHQIFPIKFVKVNGVAVKPTV